MKSFLFVIIVFYNLSSFGQKQIEIGINNPGPRVGEKILFSINVDFFIENIQEKLNGGIHLTNSPSINDIWLESKKFERVIIFNHEGLNTIGPFNFEFNGKNYITNKIEVNVLPKIKLEENVIIRQTELNNLQYIIIEQLIKNKIVADYNERGEVRNYMMGGVLPNDAKFTKLDSIPNENIEVLFFDESKEHIIPENTASDLNGFTYFKRTYLIKFRNEFKGEYVFTEKDFENLPSGYKLGSITIKN